MEWLTEPFSYGFMQRAALVVVLSAAVSAWLGVHITLRRLSFVGDALAHATLPGLVLAHILKWPLLIGALISSLCAVFGVSWSSRKQLIGEDSAIGVLYTGFFAIGIIGMTQFATSQDLTHVLLGNALGVQDNEILVIIGVTLVCSVVLFCCHRFFTITLLDPNFATSIGYRPDLARLLLLALAASVVVVAISVAGLILTVALIITPAATARLLCQRMGTTIILSCGLAVFCGLAGLLLAYHLEWPTGATIVVVLSLIFFSAQVYRHVYQ